MRRVYSAVDPSGCNPQRKSAAWLLRLHLDQSAIDCQNVAGNRLVAMPQRSDEWGQIDQYVFTLLNVHFLFSRKRLVLRLHPPPETTMDIHFENRLLFTTFGCRVG